MFARCGEHCESDFQGEIIDLDVIIAVSIRQRENQEKTEWPGSPRSLDSEGTIEYPISTLTLKSLEAEEKVLQEKAAEIKNELAMHAASIAAKDVELRNLRHILATQTKHALVDNDSGNITPTTPVTVLRSPRSPCSSNRIRASFYKDDKTAMELLSESEDGDATSYRMADMLNMVTLQGSALGKSLPVQVAIYGVAFCGVIFVLLYSSQSLQEGDSDHRRLAGGVLPIMKNTAFTVTCAGLLAFVAYLLKQPLILGYLLGGVLVGPLCLKIVPSSQGIQELSSLGLLLVLFMVGLELDIRRLLQMGKVALTAGVVQFPICGAITYGVLKVFHAMGISLGGTEYAILYVALTCGISSTTLAVNALSEMGDAESALGRVTIGIATCQDLWVVLVLAIQPLIIYPEPIAILETVGKICIVVFIAVLYAKYVIPAMMVSSSSAVELVLVLSLAWCFFIVCVAMLPLIGLGLELAALVAGIALATFPYSMEFNGKVRYIRDFFMTLFFAGLGMHIPALDISSIAKALLVSIVVLGVRWLGIYIPVVGLGAANRLGVLATINLAHVSEFTLVICSLGFSHGHIGAETLTIMIWVYILITVVTSNLLRYNYAIYSKMARCARRMNQLAKSRDESKKEPDPENEHRGILLLGFHRITAMLIHEFEHRSPHLLKQIQVVDFNDDISGPLEQKGVRCSCGSFTTADSLAQTVKGNVDLVISTIPDTMLRGITNKQLLEVAMEVWPDAHTVGIADTPEEQKELYETGASYVIRSAVIVADRLYGLLSEHCKKVGNHSTLNSIFENFRGEDNGRGRNSQIRRSIKSLSST